MARQLSWLERRANNAKVAGSIPPRATNLFDILKKMRTIFTKLFRSKNCRTSIFLLIFIFDHTCKCVEAIQVNLKEKSNWVKCLLFAHKLMNYHLRCQNLYYFFQKLNKQNLLLPLTIQRTRLKENVLERELTYLIDIRGRHLQLSRANSQKTLIYLQKE